MDHQLSQVFQTVIKISVGKMVLFLASEEKQKVALGILGSGAAGSVYINARNSKPDRGDRQIALRTRIYNREVPLPARKRKCSKLTEFQTKDPVDEKDTCKSMLSHVGSSYGLLSMLRPELANS